MPPLLVFPTDMKLNPLPTIFVLGLSTGLLSATVTHVPATLANTDNAAGGVDSTWANGDDGKMYLLVGLAKCFSQYDHQQKTVDRDGLDKESCD